KTGELLGWEGWVNLQGNTTLSESSVERGFKTLERLGALEIEHGRYNHKTKQRAGNKYRAKFDHLNFTNPSPVTGSTNPSNTPGPTRQIPPDQPVRSDGRLGEVGLGESDSVKKRDSDGRFSEESAQGNSGTKKNGGVAADFVGQR